MKTKKEILSDKILTIIGLFAILFMLLAIVAIIHPEGFDPIKYWGFYYWAYKLFGEQLYFPYFLSKFFEFFLFLFFLAIIVIAAISSKKQGKLSKLKLLWFTFGVILISFVAYLIVSKSLTIDLPYIQKNEYCEQKNDLHELRRHRNKGRGGGIYYHLGRLEIDVYQYRDLKAKRENFVLTFDNFDKHIQRKEKYSNLPPLTAEDKRKIISSWQTLDKEYLTRLLDQLGLEFKITINVYYLPASKRVIKYELE